MKFFALAAVIAPLFVGSLAKTFLANVQNLKSVCSVDTSVPAQYIGKDKNVLVQTLKCPVDAVEQRSIEERQTNRVNECGANCATNCFPGSGGGPVNADCTVIADALLYDNQNLGPPFNISSGATISMQFQSCSTFYLDQSAFPQTYCRSDWSSLVNWLSSDCSAANGAHGGNCVANDGAWFVQVQHS